MARWTVTISGKGIRKDAVEKLAKSLQDKYGEGALVRVENTSPPEGRAERFSKALDLVSEARYEFEQLRDEMQDWYDSIPENLQQGDKAAQVETAREALEECVEEAENLEGKEVEFPSMMG